MLGNILVAFSAFYEMQAREHNSQAHEVEEKLQVHKRIMGELWANKLAEKF
jgi:hypothetical protein